MNNNGLHLTTNFHTIKRWIESRGGVPSRVKVGRREYPTVSFKEFPHCHSEAVSWPEFFALMVKHDFAFLCGNDHEDVASSMFCKFVPRENFVDQLRAEEKIEDMNLLRDFMRVFS